MKYSCAREELEAIQALERQKKNRPAHGRDRHTLSSAEALQLRNLLITIAIGRGGNLRTWARTLGRLTHSSATTIYYAAINGPFPPLLQRILSIPPPTAEAEEAEIAKVRAKFRDAREALIKLRPYLPLIRAVIALRREQRQAARDARKAANIAAGSAASHHRGEGKRAKARQQHHLARIECDFDF